jgi:ABC-type multidrug transport system fused ATPase/permease subunit
VLKNLNFIIQPGQIAAFVGPSGSGKSTIVQLLERFYDIPTDDMISSGQILIDDVDIRNYDPLCLRNFISLVGQEPVIFKRSVKENIRYGKLNANDFEIEQAAEKAQIKYLVNEEVLDFPVSGGEKQRIAIARAIIRAPKILLLDEATSALDKNTEIEIQKSLEEMMVNRTSIVIAHRYFYYLFIYFLFFLFVIIF